MKNIIIAGVPRAGKSTMSKYGLTYFESAKDREKVFEQCIEFLSGKKQLG